MKLWQKGLIVFIIGLVLNTILMNLGVGGLLRELTRLTAIVGLILLIIGLFSLLRRK